MALSFTLEIPVGLRRHLAGYLIQRILINRKEDLEKMLRLAVGNDWIPKRLFYSTENKRLTQMKAMSDEMTSSEQRFKFDIEFYLKAVIENRFSHEIRVRIVTLFDSVNEMKEELSQYVFLDDEGQGLLKIVRKLRHIPSCPDFVFVIFKVGKMFKDVLFEEPFGSEEHLKFDVQVPIVEDIKLAIVEVKSRRGKLGKHQKELIELCEKDSDLLFFLLNVESEVSIPKEVTLSLIALE